MSKDTVLTPTAFPVVFKVAAGSNDLTGAIAEVEQHHVMLGMSLRDYFAAKALPSAIEHELAIRSAHINDPGEFRYDAIARAAYNTADAMLKERSKS